MEKTMLYRFRHRILVPVALLWLVLSVASGAEWIIIWSRLSRNINQSAEAVRLGESLDQLFSALQDAETYAVRDLEEHLAAFPTLVHTIEEQTVLEHG
jgi:hypothetical protein